MLGCPAAPSFRCTRAGSRSGGNATRVMRPRKGPLHHRTPCRATEEDSPISTTTTQGRQKLEGQADSPQGESEGPVSNGWTTLTKVLAETVASPLFYLVAGLIAIKLVASLGEQSGTILVLAALPVTGLTLISKSSLGQQVQQDLEKKLPQLQAEAMEMKQQYQQARERSYWYGPNRPQLPSYLGGHQPHLKGEVAGDYGFDPLKLSEDRKAFERYYEVELLHARWAMLGAVGCLVPEVLDLQGVQLGEPIWWKVGASKLQGDLTLNWGGIEGFRIAGKQGIGIIAACQVVLMGGPEYARYVGIRSLEPVGVFLPGDTNYPGGAPFDPLNLSKDPDGFVDQAVREIKNGRLAMLAMLGYFVQAGVTRQGPVQNLLDFVADPYHNNVLKFLGGPGS